MLRAVSPDCLAEILDDLQHDLGKHLALPLRLLPADADDAAVRAAARTALCRTRRGPDGATDAATLWADFRAELAPALAGAPGWRRLEGAVERALSWTARLDDPAPLDRGRLAADLTAVGAAIRALEAADG